MVIAMKGSTRETAIADARDLFKPSKLFLLSKQASPRGIQSLLEQLNGDSEIANYVMLTGQDIVPANLLAEAKVAVSLLKHDATFWSNVRDQEEIAIGTPGRHHGKVAIWALQKDAERIWDMYI